MPALAIPGLPPMNRWSLRLLSPALACLAPLAAQEPEKELDPEWLARDLRRIEEVRQVLGAAELTVEGLQRALGSPDVREDRDIGFGARRVCLAAYGGYTTVWLRVLAEAPADGGESRVAWLAVTQSGYVDSWGLVAAELRAAWARPVREEAQALAFERVEPERARALSKRTEEALGGSVAVDVPAEHARAFALLTSPCDDVIVGKAYSIDGGPPPGAEEIRALVEAGRLDLVRAVLRGLNPEGRAYAAHALLAGGELEPRDEAAIDRLRALPVELTVCRGCLVTHVRLDGALAVLDE